MRKFHGLCYDLSFMRLHSVEPGRVYTLAEFVEQHAGHREACEQQLSAFHDEVFDTVLDACRVRVWGVGWRERGREWMLLSRGISAAGKHTPSSLQRPVQPLSLPAP